MSRIPNPMIDSIVLLRAQPCLQDTVWRGWALPVNEAGKLLHIDL